MFSETLCAVLIIPIEEDETRQGRTAKDEQKNRKSFSQEDSKSSVCLVYWKKSWKAYGFSLETLSRINNRGIEGLFRVMEDIGTSTNEYKLAMNKFMR